ncbi:MAG: type IX secretion system outer membrane channel protein PorV [Paludibacteraceae bacterium]|nr:type IX secretion system outer membrane channel protein PorV [Paludibacteraceae bacterium]
MKKNKIKAISLAALLTAGITTVSAVNVQDDGGATYNPLQTAIPSLSIAPDAVGGGMGDVGAATAPDYNSQHWNPAKYALSQSRGGVALSYTPWLRKIVDDIDLVYLAGYYKPSDRTAIGASFRYFNMGKINLTGTPDATGVPQDLGVAQPYEMAFDASFSMLMSEYWSAGVALRFIYSDLFNGMSDEDQYSKAKAFGADIAFAYRKPVQINEQESTVGFGVSITNIGNKVSYDNDASQQFIPTNFRIGGSFEYAFDEFNRLGLAVDFNKLLVPTPYGSRDNYASDQEYNDAKERYEECSSIGGIFRSIGDAPGGFKEEMKEFNFSVGLQYSYNRKFMVRGGYYNESADKGNRKYFSVGAGFHLMIFELNAAYLISIAQTNPLDRTLRFSLGFDLGGIKSLFGSADPVEEE